MRVNKVAPFEQVVIRIGNEPASNIEHVASLLVQVTAIILKFMY